MKSILFLTTCLFLSSCTHKTIRNPNSDSSESLPKQVLEMVNYPPLGLNLRAGYLLERDRLKGCVIYLQGLGDSIRNHQPYFSKLQENGYRIIYFDYLGQGGSQGSMDKTRIKTSTGLQTEYEIPEQAEFIWNHYKNVTNEFGHDCSRSKKLLIGWSTGGLASYRMAFEKRADAVVLIAPGIHPRTLVGESAEHPSRAFLFKQIITEDTLTRQKYTHQPNPHLDPIKPKSPFYVMSFATNLLLTSFQARTWKIDRNIPGLVFLSGEEDTYVNRDKTIKTLEENASHFKIIKYDGALHELDNETSDVTESIQTETIRFFDSLIDR